MHKRGDIRDDGKVFWQYHKAYKNGEYWITKEQHEKFVQDAILYKQKRAIPPKEKRNKKRGDTRNDGKIFWGYHTSFLNGEYWLEKTEYEERNTKAINQAILWNNNNPVKKKESLAKWYSKNKQRQLVYKRKYYKDNIIRERKRIVEYTKSRKSKDPLYKLKCDIRNLICLKIRSNGYTKKSKTQEILGCSWDFFKNYIEQKFREGMTWENRNLWHLDHIVPLASATTEEQVLKLNHYSNFQPLWAFENLSKGKKLINTI